MKGGNSRRDGRRAAAISRVRWAPAANAPGSAVAFHPPGSFRASEGVPTAAALEMPRSYSSGWKRAFRRLALAASTAVSAVARM